MKLNGMGRANMPDMRTCQGKQGLGAFGFVVTSFVKAERWMLAIDCYWWKWHSFLRQIHLVSWMGRGSFTSVLGACVLFLQCFVGAWLAFSCTHSGYRVVKGIYIELSYCLYSVQVPAHWKLECSWCVPGCAPAEVRLTSCLSCHLSSISGSCTILGRKMPEGVTIDCFRSDWGMCSRT